MYSRSKHGWRRLGLTLSWKSGSRNAGRGCSPVRVTPGPDGCLLENLRLQRPARSWTWGWTPVTALKWLSPNQLSYWDQGDRLMVACPSPLLREVRAAVQAAKWRRAAEAELGRGCEHGVGLRVARQRLALLARQGSSAACSMAIGVAAAGCWPQERVHRMCDGPGQGSAACPRRGELAETALHRYWECQANDDMECEHVKASAWMKQLAKGGELACPAYWCRGITPASWVAVEAPPAAP